MLLWDDADVDATKGTTKDRKWTWAVMSVDFFLLGLTDKHS